MSLRETPAIESPCKLICQLDLASGQCFGCGRTREEIATWTRYSDLQRKLIMHELPKRLAKLD
ncbi:MAG: DUF1289 domain-containing protein [Alphaproteobacteria bacterium]